MKMRTATGLAVAFAVSSTLAAAQTPATPRPSQAPPAATHHDMKSSNMNADEHFVMEAASGGMAEVALGKLAADKASSAKVKDFGQRMVTDHGKANDELKSLASSKNINLPNSMDAKHQATYDRLSKLSGAAFDRAYMADMLADHQKDVAAFRKEAQSGKDSEIKAWAAKTLPTLEEHLKLAQSAKGQNTN